MQGLTGKDFDELRHQMVRFARQQLHNEELAEDVVQEALLGAFKNSGSFVGNAAYKTWVFAILKHKIADQLRSGMRSKEVKLQSAESDEGEDYGDWLFDHRGHWSADEMPRAWGSPEETMNSAQFWEIFEICLDQLPGVQGRVFMMREFIGLETSEICDTLALSVTHLNVILYRARMRLRLCLEQKWFSAV